MVVAVGSETCGVRGEDTALGADRDAQHPPAGVPQRR